jgi:phosphoribosylglycinamide formyltransferase-1
VSLRVAILISGGGSNMVRLLEDMAQPGHPGTPVLVLSNTPDAGGLTKAEAFGVATEVVDHTAFGKDRAAFEAALNETLKEHSADIICLAGFMRILGAEFVAGWQGRMLNIHPSLLPKYKGLNTHQRAIDAGDSHAGCSVHLVTPELDDGPILDQAAVDIQKGDTAETLAARVLVHEHVLYPRVLRQFCTDFTAR